MNSTPSHTHANPADTLEACALHSAAHGCHDADAALPARHVDHAHHAHGDSLAKTTFLATLHCLTGCSIGEVLGLVLGTWWGWDNGSTIALAVGLAFVVGYACTAIPLLRSGLPRSAALKLALQADTASIATMELVDNLVMLLIPGAMDAPIASALFWGAMGVSLVIAAAAAYPVNYWLIARGRGHAVVHAHH